MMMDVYRKSQSLVKSEFLVVPEKLSGVVFSEELVGGVHFRLDLEEELRFVQFVGGQTEYVVTLDNDSLDFLGAGLDDRV
jgi:hypothetical protein